MNIMEYCPPKFYFSFFSFKVLLHSVVQVVVFHSSCMLLLGWCLAVHFSSLFQPSPRWRKCQRPKGACFHFSGRLDPRIEGQISH